MNKKLLVIITLLLLAYAFFAHLNSIGLRAEEPKRAILGIETLLDRNYIIPHIHGYAYYDKPPFYNWILAFFFFLFGSFDEWVVRLPGVLSILLTGIIGFIIIKKYTNKELAYFSSMAYITSADLLFYGSVNSGEIDLFYSMVVFIQVISIFWFYEKKKYLLMYVSSYLFVSIGFLTKGLPSIAFQGMTLIIMVIYFKSWKILFSWQHVLGIGLFVLICGGYYYAYSLEGDAIGYLVSLSKQSSQRSFNEYPFILVIEQIALFPIQILKLLLPWSLLVIFMIRKDFLRTIKSNKLVLFSSLFVIANIIIYWLSPEMRDRYLYMFLPFIAFTLIYFYYKFQNTDIRRKKWIRGIFGGVMVLTVFFFIAYPFLNTINKEASYPVIVSIVFSILLAFITFLYFRHRKFYIYLFILFLIITRIGFNYTLLPHFHASTRTSEYSYHVEQMIMVTGNEPIFYTGNPLTYHPDLSIFRNQLYKSDITIPPLTAFQIPYYIVKSNDHILYYEQNPKPGKFYLAYESFTTNFLLCFQI